MLATSPLPQQSVTSGRESNHELVVKTFDSPSKCDTCTSVMFGIVRQGLFCKSELSSVHKCIVVYGDKLVIT